MQRSVYLNAGTVGNFAIKKQHLREVTKTLLDYLNIKFFKLVVFDQFNRVYFEAVKVWA